MDTTIIIIFSIQSYINEGINLKEKFIFVKMFCTFVYNLQKTMENYHYYLIFVGFNCKLIYT